MRSLLASLVFPLSLGFGLIGCSSAPIVGTEPTVLWEDAREPATAGRAELSDDEARRIAIAHDVAYACEQTARAMHKKDLKRGWAVMRHCIRRNDYSDLEILIEGIWAEQMAKDADSALLFAHVIAIRGGDVGADLRLLRRRKMPVYSLQAALSEPESYRGRLVILRGTARQGRTVAGARAFRLVETKVMAESEWVTRPGSGRIINRSNNALADQPDISVRGRGIVERNERESSERVEVLHNVNVETGLEMIGRVEGDEPSLEPATDYVLVVRFDGVKEAVDADGEVDEDATGVVVGYFEPETGMFARLGR
ncbi:MAG: hypothetical protein Q8O67_23465 [Deltaproteobacteria bacterium]|nr:hypothetical protein [Deltaproteobacteria bacterium]